MKLFLLSLLTMFSVNSYAQTCENYNSIIYGGQTYDTGTVIVSNDANNLYITLSSNTALDWKIKDYYIYAGTGPIPSSSPGIPAPALFPYQGSFTVQQTDVVVTVPLVDLGISCGTPLNVVVNTVMQKVDADGFVTQQEQGWAYGPNRFENQRFGWWFNYTPCCLPEGETGCTSTKGYWKNNNKYAKQSSLKTPWPITEYTTTTYSEDTLLCSKSWLNILKAEPKSGDAWTILAQQYITSVLNIATGASTGSIVDSSVYTAKFMLETSCSTFSKSDPTTRQTALELSLLLAAYNNGLTGPGYCGVL